MMKVTQLAKQKAVKALQLRERLPNTKRFGLDKEQASKLGINSGVERAKQLINNNYINNHDAERVAAFYSRFKNCKTTKCEGAIDLWGGRQFGVKAVSYVKRIKR